MADDKSPAPTLWAIKLADGTWMGDGGDEPNLFARRSDADSLADFVNRHWVAREFCPAVVRPVRLTEEPSDE